MDREGREKSKLKPLLLIGRGVFFSTLGEVDKGDTFLIHGGGGKKRGIHRGCRLLRGESNLREALCFRHGGGKGRVQRRSWDQENGVASALGKGGKSGGLALSVDPQKIGWRLFSEGEK